MRKILTLCLVSIMAFALAFTVGCNSGGSATLTLNKTQATLYVGQTDILEPIENVQVTYTSNNEAVIYVTPGGVINALKAGSATVTARSGNVTATCEFTVLDNVQFTLNKSQVSMAKGDELNLSALVTRTINGVASTAGTLSATSSNTEVASIDGGAIALNKNGNAVVTITWAYGGQNYTAELSVTVENKVELAIEQPQQQIFAYGQNNTMQLDTSLVVNRSEVLNPELVWESSNNEVATVSNGLITGVTYGTATITAKYNYDGEVYTASTEVNVERAVVEGTKTYKFGYKNQNALLDADDYIGKIVKVEHNYATLNVDTDSQNNVKVLGSNFTEEGQVTVDIFTDKTQTTATFDMVTAILMNKEDLDKMDEYCRPADWDYELMKNTYLYSYGGTILLGDDIDYGGGTYTQEVYYGVNDYLSGRGGVYGSLNFDGQGHSISNIVFADTWSGMLFGYEWRGTSSVKNLSILNATAAFTVGRSIFTHFFNGDNAIENVYVQVKSTVPASTVSSILVGEIRANANVSIKNVVVDVTSATNASTLAAIIKTSDTSYLSSFNGVYGIGVSVDIGYKADSGDFVKLAENGTGYFGGAYANDALFMEDQSNIFINDFAKVFSIETVGEDKILKFMGTTVKTLNPVDTSTVHYSFGYKQSDLSMPTSDFDGSITKVEIFNGKELTFNVSGTNYVIPRANFDSFGSYVLKITTSNGTVYKNVNVINAYINDLNDLQKIVTDYSTVVDSQYSGKFILTDNIDCGGALFDAQIIWANLDFDGQGYTISNYQMGSSSGLFGTKISGSVKNLALTGVTSGAYGNNWAGAIARYCYGRVENIYVSGKIDTGVAQCSLLFAEINTQAVIKNVLVNVENCTRSDAMAIGYHAGAGSHSSPNKNFVPTNLTNVYSIDNSATNYIKHVSYKYVSGSSILFDNLNAPGGYVGDSAFLADKDTIFTGDFAKVFSIAEESGATVLKFFGKTVKTFAQA